MKERYIITSMVGLLALIGLIAITRSTDVIYVTIGVLFFGLCLAYVEGCGRL